MAITKRFQTFAALDKFFVSLPIKQKNLLMVQKSSEPNHRLDVENDVNNVFCRFLADDLQDWLKLSNGRV